MTLYHGSNFKIEKYLEPRPSRVIDNEEAVFASPYKEFVLAFMGKKWNDNDMELGSYKFKSYLIEKRPDAFSEIYNGQKGYLYEVSKTGFKKDNRLGMQEFERIKKSKTKIMKTVVIKNVLKELKNSNIKMIKYGSLKFVFFKKPKNVTVSNKSITIVSKDSFNFEDLLKLDKKNNLIKSKNIDYKDIRKNLYGDTEKKIDTMAFVDIDKDTRVFVIF